MASVAASFISILGRGRYPGPETPSAMSSALASSRAHLGPLAGRACSAAQPAHARRDCARPSEPGELRAAICRALRPSRSASWTSSGSPSWRRCRPRSSAPWWATSSRRPRTPRALRFAWSRPSGTRRCSWPPSPDPVDAVLGLGEASRERGAAAAARPDRAAGRAAAAGDWYGRPGNLASRLTEFARRAAVVAVQGDTTPRPTRTRGRTRAGAG